jgi:outer membrane protein assembly factor BamB
MNTFGVITMNRLIAATCFFLTTLPIVSAADWPQFRGLNGSGVATDAKPPLKWTAKDGVTWSTKLPGPGSSSPIVVGNQVFVTCYSGYGADAQNTGSSDKLLRHLVCIERATGKVSWTKDVPAVTPEDNYRGYISEHGYASHTPASDGEAVYVFFGKSGVLAYDLTGKKLWQTSVGKDSDIRGWGSGASPILHKELVIVNASSESRAVVALNKKTGKEEWRADGRKLSLSFGTPALVKVSKERTDLVVAMPGEVWGLDADTGKKRWTASIRPDGNISPSVLAGAGMVYITGGYQTKGSAAVTLGGEKEGKVAWESKLSSYVPTPVLHNGRLYCVNEDGFAQCLNAENGKTVYEERLSVKGVGGRGSRPFYASPALANGYLYVPSRRSGVYVLKAGEKFEQVEQNAALDDTDFNGTPAIADNQLFLRSNSHVYCIGSKD